MLTREQNEAVTRVGPGTPMGEVMRRYWIPALLPSEVPEPDSPPVRVRLLGEDLVAFRDTAGRVGLLEEFCAHRCASLFLGRNEEHGLRCVYHGWKFDVTGQCVDMPNEPAQYRFADRVRLTAYPCVELGGVIWTYMGPPEKQPSPPDFEWTRAPASHRFVSRMYQENNYLQGIEGGIDPTHGGFLHNRDLSNIGALNEKSLTFDVKADQTDYGVRLFAVKDLGDDGTYTRIYQFVMPFHQLRPGQIDRSTGHPEKKPMIQGHMWVPIDDENIWAYNWMYSIDEDKPFTHEDIERAERQHGREPGDEVGNVRTRTRANDWLIDREAQKTKSFTGIPGINMQDVAVQESMRPIVDRTKEHLGSTDRAVMVLRKVLLDAVQDVQAGRDAPGTDAATYRLARAVDEVLPRGVRPEEALHERELARR